MNGSWWASARPVSARPGSRWRLPTRFRHGRRRFLLALSRRYADFDPADLETFTLPTYPRTTSGGAAIVEIQESEAAPVLEEFRDEEPAAPAGDEPVLEPTEVDLTVLNSAGVSGLAVRAEDGDQWVSP